MFVWIQFRFWSNDRKKTHYKLKDFWLFWFKFLAVASDSFCDGFRIQKWHLEVVKLIHSVYYIMGDRSSSSQRLLLSIDFYTEAQLQSYTTCNFINSLLKLIMVLPLLNGPW